MEVSGQSAGKWISKRTLTQRVQQQQHRTDAALLPKNACVDDYFSVNLLDGHLPNHLHSVCSNVGEAAMCVESLGGGVCALRQPHGAARASTAPRAELDIDVEAHIGNRMCRDHHHHRHSHNNGNTIANKTKNVEKIYSYSPNTLNSLSGKCNLMKTHHANHAISNDDAKSSYAVNTVLNAISYTNTSSCTPHAITAGPDMNNTNNSNNNNNNNIHPLYNIDNNSYDRHHSLRVGSPHVRIALQHVDANHSVREDVPRFNSPNNAASVPPAGEPIEGATIADASSGAALCCPSAIGSYNPAISNIDTGSSNSTVTQHISSNATLGATRRPSASHHTAKMNAMDNNGCSSNSSNNNDGATYINSHWSGTSTGKTSTNHRFRDDCAHHGTALCSCEVALPTPRSQQFSASSTGIVVGGIAIGAAVSAAPLFSKNATSLAPASSATGIGMLTCGTDKKENVSAAGERTSSAYYPTHDPHVTSISSGPSITSTAHTRGSHSQSSPSHGSAIHNLTHGSTYHTHNHTSTHSNHSNNSNHSNSNMRIAHGTCIKSAPSPVNYLIHPCHSPSTKVVVGGSGVTAALPNRIWERGSTRETATLPPGAKRVTEVGWASARAAAAVTPPSGGASVSGRSGDGGMSDTTIAAAPAPSVRVDHPCWTKPSPPPHHHHHGAGTSGQDVMSAWNSTHSGSQGGRRDGVLTAPRGTVPIDTHCTQHPHSHPHPQQRSCPVSEGGGARPPLNHSPILF